MHEKLPPLSSQSQHPTANQVCINICNGGEPISPEILSKLSQPFFSTKPNGTGLGLAITKRIVNAHNGELSIQSNQMTGTVVSVRLPRNS